MTRTRLVLALCLLASPTLAGTYPDVPWDHWAYDPIEELTELNLLKGFDDHLFHGDQAVSRYELAVLVHRIVKYVEEKMQPRRQTALPTPDLTPVAAEAPAEILPLESVLTELVKRSAPAVAPPTAEVPVPTIDG